MITSKLSTLSSFLSLASRVRDVMQTNFQTVISTQHSQLAVFGAKKKKSASGHMQMRFEYVNCIKTFFFFFFAATRETFCVAI